MTVGDLAPAIGQEVSLKLDDMLVAVKVLDVRTVWKRIDCLITPVSGLGEKWVSVSSLRKII